MRHFTCGSHPSLAFFLKWAKISWIFRRKESMSWLLEVRIPSRLKITWAWIRWYIRWTRWVIWKLTRLTTWISGVSHTKTACSQSSKSGSRDIQTVPSPPTTMKFTKSRSTRSPLGSYSYSRASTWVRQLQTLSSSSKCSQIQSFFSKLFLS